MSQIEHPPRADSLESCYTAGLEALESSDLDAARAWADRCDRAAETPEDPRAAGLRGAVTAAGGDLEGALAHYRRGFEHASDGVRAEVVRATLEALVAGGALDQATGVLEQMSRRMPEPARAFSLVELAYFKMLGGDARGAGDAAREAVSIAGASPHIAWSAARVLEATGEPGRAADVLAPVADQLSAPAQVADAARLYLDLQRYPEAERLFRRLKTLDPDYALLAQHGMTWCRIRKGDWRGALEAALAATRVDRFDLTTAFLAYAKDRLFGKVPDAEQRERELGDRFMAELRQNAELHSGESAEWAA
jgi:tetratricopeptide (TPR) repeat protein